MAGNGRNSLRAALQERGWSYTRLAAELRRHAAGAQLPKTESLVRLISRWVNNHQQPDDFYRDLLAKALGRPRAELFHDEGTQTELGVAAVPAELPHDVANFIGRAGETEKLRRRVLGADGVASGAVVTIDGPPGVGKSALAVHVAHQLCEHFPHAQLFADLRGDEGAGLDPTVVLHQFLRALGATSAELHSNPEFLREGSAVYDTLFPDRIVVGADSPEPLETMRLLYEPIIGQTFPTELDPRPKAAVPFVRTDLASAELIKYAANAFLAAKISLINEISTLCELTGADVGMVANGIGLDGRIGSRFLNAGIGWGGSCFPKDVSALRAAAREYGYETPLLDATVAVNEAQRGRVIGKLQHHLHALGGKRVALLGLSFKPNTDDLRGAPSLQIARSLDSLGAKVVGYDPVAGKDAAALLPDGAKVVFDPYEALEGAHAAVLVTEWEVLKGLDPRKAASLMRDPKLVVDGRNVLDPASWREAGLRYAGFGRE